MAIEIGRIPASSMLLVLASLPAANCHNRSPDPLDTARTPLMGGSVTLELIFPPTRDATTLALVANGHLLLADRSVVTGAVSNMGDRGTAVGVEARTGDIVTKSTLTLSPRSVVDGRIETTTPIRQDPSGRIFGETNLQARLSPPRRRSLQVIFPTSLEGDIVLEPGQSRTAMPGRYGVVSVKSDARLRLHAGTYYADTWAVEPGAVLEVDQSQGPVTVYVSQPFAFRGSLLNSAPISRFILGVVGPGTISVDTPFHGTILAPDATLILGGQAARHRGAFVARNIEVRPGVLVMLQPGLPFPDCDDGNACTARDVVVDGTCVGRDPVTFGVPESDPSAARCSDGASPVGCRAYDCSVGLPTAVWLAAPSCGPHYPACTASCPSLGCIAARPRSNDYLSCQCSCFDPTSDFASSVAVNGCGATLSTSCEQLCTSYGPSACGTASSCEFGACKRQNLAGEVIAAGVCRVGDEVAAPILADYVAIVETQTSQLTILVGKTLTTVPVTGSIGLNFDMSPSPATPGRATLGYLRLATGPFQFFGRRVQSIELESRGGAGTFLKTQRGERASFEFPANSFPSLVTVLADGIPHTFDALSPGALKGVVDVKARAISLSL